MSPSPRGPYNLVTVNTAPERAARLVGRMIDALKDQYDIRHVANCASMSLETKSKPFKLDRLTYSQRRNRRAQANT